jgi:carbon-monoxide dehydrogenase large subunit
VRCADGVVVGPRLGSTAEIAKVGHLRMDGWPRGAQPLRDATATYEPAISTGVSYATRSSAEDTETGFIEFLDFAVAEDCERWSTRCWSKEIRGGVVQGIGTALYEEIPYDESGQPLAVTFAEYLLPNAAEMPSIKIGHLHTPTPHTEYGMKGMGEGGAVAPPAAIANAVRDALAAPGASRGAEVNETPITPRRVLAAIRQAQVAPTSP